MLFDTHCHITSGSYNKDREDMIQRALDAGMKYMMCPGTDVPSSAAAVALSHQYKEVYAAVGIHPEDAASATPEGFEQIRQWLRTEPKVVAIGEVGLDYYWPEPSHEIQQEVFIEQIKMALEFDMPLDIHDRKPTATRWTSCANTERGRGASSTAIRGASKWPKSSSRWAYYIGFTGTMVFPKVDEAQAHRRRAPHRPHPHRNGLPVPHAAAVPGQAERAGLRSVRCRRNRPPARHDDGRSAADYPGKRQAHLRHHR